jgi:hypothetical protein
VAHALTLFKAIVGTGGPALLHQVQQQQPSLLSDVQKKLQQLETLSQSGAIRRPQGQAGQTKYQYHDDKALYSE